MKSQLRHREARPERQKTEPDGSKRWEWEVLPPEDRHRSASLEALFRWLAVVMDNFLRFPGTKLRFGVDPIIGLLPGIGDAASAIISTLALVYAARYRLPKILLVRMALNILINELVGIIPGLGDAFSFWFKSNLRNYELLRRYAAAPERARKADWIFVFAVVAVLFLIVCVGLIVSLLVFRAIWQFLSAW
jgi:Domain of unknown function (DUF4112)